MRKYTVIIPSCDNQKLLDCINSLTSTHGEIRLDQIVIVSDGLAKDVRHTLEDMWKEKRYGVRWVEGKKPFVFAEAINAGVRAADPDSDIGILGDDVRFETQGGLDKIAQASEGAAVIAPEVIGACGPLAQRHSSDATSADWVAFICAYIPRAVWDAVGPLDERFVGYGYDDVDWCRRAAGHGEIRVTHDVTVRHLPESSYRNNPGWTALHAQNRSYYDQKWGVARAWA